MKGLWFRGFKQFTGSNMNGDYLGFWNCLSIIHLLKIHFLQNGNVANDHDSHLWEDIANEVICLS